MRVVVFGCREIANRVIEYLQDNNYNIPLVVTHDAERDRVFGTHLVSEYCDVLGIDNIRFDGKIDADIITNVKPDIILSVYYRKILFDNILSIPKMGCINIHPSLLPLNRGPAPSLWNILNGDEYAGTTMHYMVRGVDAGDIIAQNQLKIENRNGFELHRDLMFLGLDLFYENFPKIVSGVNDRVPQDHNAATYCISFSNNLRYIYWNNSDLVIRRIRTFTKPYDGAIAYAKNLKMLIWKGKKLKSRNSLKPPGFYEFTENGIVVQTATLPILITNWDVISGKLKTKGRFKFGPLIEE